MVPSPPQPQPPHSSVPRAPHSQRRHGSAGAAVFCGLLSVVLQAGAAQPPTPAAATAPASQRQIVLELRRRQISLLEGTQLIGRWPVAIGGPSTPTPTGRVTVLNKVINPRYESTRSGKVNATVGPQGPLGDRWIGFLRSGKNQYGIHGTPDAWSWTVMSRAAVSNGCVRMLTPHVRQLFEQVDVGTAVIVKP